MRSETPVGLVLAGDIFQTPTPDRLDVRRDATVVVDADGLITHLLEPGSDADRIRREHADLLVSLGDDQVLLPGLIDLHIHAPQWPQLGTGLDLPLERWLVDYTFPLEARYQDVDFARQVWADLVPSLLGHGTTTAVYYGTVHQEATFELARTCVSLGQRAFVGRVAMDHPDGTPQDYRDRSSSDGVAASAESIELIRALGVARVQPIITPRFIPACTDGLLAGLGELAEEQNVLVQTHCSESDWEHHYVLDRFGRSDTEALNGFGLVRPGTVLAHADHVSASDLGLIAERRAGVAHCPLSNIYFGNAVFPARRALEAGVSVGLGTDISGGASPSLLRQVPTAVDVSRILEDGVDASLPADRRGVAHSRIDTTAAFWLATVGGAAALRLPLGLLAVGNRFDAFAVSTSRLGIWPEIDHDMRVFEKVARLASRHDITDVWVDGVPVGGHQG